MSRESRRPTNALRREIEDEDFLTQCGHWMEKTDKGTTHLQGIPQGAPISPAKIYLRAKQRRNPNLLWECEIGRRGVRSRTTAGVSSSDS
ncbi:unnamed protein product [Withania somnifera]